jgi:hypothetical protein
VTGSATAFEALSNPFTLKGLLVETPSAGTSWDIGDTNTIQVRAAEIGISLSLYYSPNGVTFDMENPIGRLGRPVQSGLNDLTWGIESYRVPSTNARIRAVSVQTGDTIDSDPFTVAGILVTDPTGFDLWAAGETNHIAWIAVGTANNVTLDLIMPDNSVIPITNGLSGTEFEWPTPLAAVGAGARIRVTDTSGYSALSEPFKIVSDLTIEIIAPADGAYLKNSETYQVVWAKAGTMSENFEVTYSFDNFASTNPITGTPVLTNEQYVLDWALSDPAVLGTARVRVRNADNTAVSDTTGDLELVAKFEVKSPEGGELLYAGKETAVAWSTKGNVTNVNLYYSTDALRDPSKWVLINTGGEIEGRGHDQESQYFWTVADDVSQSVWLRVQDATFPQMFPANVTGPYDDCDATFRIGYYTIQWHVYDEETGADLDMLSVSDSSGWSESGLQSPVVHQYPYGFYDTVWYREFFADRVIFNWVADGNKIIDVPMKKSDQEPAFNVMANFSYNSAVEKFDIQSWLERGGQILDTAESSTIRIYDSAGALVGTVSTNVSKYGVFWQNWLVADGESQAGREFSPSEVFFAKVEVRFSGVIYSSGLTFMLRQPASDDIQDVITYIEESSSNILSEVSGVGQQITQGFSDVLTDTGAILTDTGAILTDTGVLRTDVSEIEGILRDTLVPSMTNIQEQLVSVIGPSVTGLTDQITVFSEDMTRQTARIITRPDVVPFGSTNVFLYKTMGTYEAGLVRLAVYEKAFYDQTTTPTTTVTTLTYSNAVEWVEMGEVVGGIYGASVVADWGTNRYEMICFDPMTQDSLTLDVVDPNYGRMATMMAYIEGEISTLDETLTALEDIPETVSNLNETVKSLDLEGVANIHTAVTNIEDMVERMEIPDLTDLQSDITNLTEIVKALNIPDLTGLETSISNLDVRVSNLDIPDLSGLEASVSNLNVKVGNLNIPDLTTLETTVSNLNVTVGETDFDALTNLTGVAATLAGVQTGMAGMSNDLVAIRAAMPTNAADQAAVDAVWTEMTNVAARVASVQISMGGVSGAIGSVDLTALGRIETGMQSAATEGMILALEQKINAFDAQLNGLAAQLAQIGGEASDASSNASSAKTAANKAATSVQQLKDSFAAGDLDAVKSELTTIRSSLRAARQDIEQIPKLVKLGGLYDDLARMTSQFGEFAASQGYRDLLAVTPPAPGEEEEEQGLDPQALLNMNAAMQEMQGAMQHLQKLVDKEVYEPVVTEIYLPGAE